jgi:hypothetical protein
VNKIAIIIGRKIKDNVDRELILNKLFLENQLKPYFLIPGEKISKLSLNENDVLKFKDVAHLRFNSLEDFKEIARNFNYFLIASWRDYKKLTDYLQQQKKKIAVYSDAGGIDFWDLGVKNLFIKSQSNIDHFCNARRNFLVNLYRKSFLKFIITGSIRYEYLNEIILKQSNKKKPRIVFFPKSISKLAKTIIGWFPGRNKNWYEDYINTVKNNYVAAGNEIKKQGYDFIVKPHYASFDRMYGESNEINELNFWRENNFDISEEDERQLYYDMDIGLGFETHSAIDVNYHNKPFIYITSNINMKPQLREFRFEKLFNIKNKGFFGYKNGFILKEKDFDKLWLPYWFGSLSNINNLEKSIHEILNSELNYKICRKIARYYWGFDRSIKSSNILVEEVTKIFGE